MKSWFSPTRALQCLQDALNARGHDLAVDGVPGPATMAALKVEGWSIEVIDGIPFKVNTNPWRRMRADVDKRERRNRSMLRQERDGLTALARLAALWTGIRAGSTCDNEALLIAALAEVEQRLVDLAASMRPNNARRRKLKRWLGHWGQRINTALARWERRQLVQRALEDWHAGQVRS